LVETGYSLPSEFVIPIVPQVRCISGPFGRTLTVRWRGNVRRARIMVRMVSRAHDLDRVAQANAPSPGTTVATRFVVPARYAREVNGAFFAVGIAARTRSVGRRRERVVLESLGRLVALALLLVELLLVARAFAGEGFLVAFVLIHGWPPASVSGRLSLGLSVAVYS
jgi:hypothetical protein